MDEKIQGQVPFASVVEMYTTDAWGTGGGTVGDLLKRPEVIPAILSRMCVALEGLQKLGAVFMKALAETPVPQKQAHAVGVETKKTATAKSEVSAVRSTSTEVAINPVLSTSNAKIAADAAYKALGKAVLARLRGLRGINSIYGECGKSRWVKALCGCSYWKLLDMAAAGELDVKLPELIRMTETSMLPSPDDVFQKGSDGHRIYSMWRPDNLVFRSNTCPPELSDHEVRSTAELAFKALWKAILPRLRGLRGISAVYEEYGRRKMVNAMCGCSHLELLEMAAAGKLETRLPALLKLAETAPFPSPDSLFKAGNASHRIYSMWLTANQITQSKPAHTPVEKLGGGQGKWLQEPPASVDITTAWDGLSLTPKAVFRSLWHVLSFRMKGLPEICKCNGHSRARWITAVCGVSLYDIEAMASVGTLKEKYPGLVELAKTAELPRPSQRFQEGTQAIKAYADWLSCGQHALAAIPHRPAQPAKGSETTVHADNGTAAFANLWKAIKARLRGIRSQYALSDEKQPAWVREMCGVSCRDLVQMSERGELDGRMPELMQIAMYNRLPTPDRMFTLRSKAYDAYMDLLLRGPGDWTLSQAADGGMVDWR